MGEGNAKGAFCPALSTIGHFTSYSFYSPAPKLRLPSLYEPQGQFQGKRMVGPLESTC